jgi:hypothetical protein
VASSTTKATVTGVVCETVTSIVLLISSALFIFNSGSSLLVEIIVNHGFLYFTTLLLLLALLGFDYSFILQRGSTCTVSVFLSHSFEKKVAVFFSVKIKNTKINNNQNNVALTLQIVHP